MKWGTSLDAQLERLIGGVFLRLRPDAPVRLPRYDSASLPDPAAWEGTLIYCPDTGEVRASDGAAWSAL